MAANAMVRKAVALANKLLGYFDWVPGLLTRVLVGFAFYDTGSGKLAHMENTVNFFATLGIPFPELNAAFVSRLEYFGGMLIFVGLFTRIVSALLSSTMIVALLTADHGTLLDSLLRKPDAAGLSDIPSFVLLVFMSWLVVKGPGAVSLDALLKKFITGGGEKPAAS